uniref:Beta-galactosidase n=1 Tax=Leersia perrieri TaxID=77586 RepID=A0A0D9XAK8_9ORYZ
MSAAAVLAVAVAAALLAAAASGYELTKNGTAITYDRRSLIIDGRREIFFSGSIHYPRSPPDVWPDLISKAKEGGLNVIETYVFWNGHEPEKGVYNFEERYDLVKFFKLIQEKDMYAIVRIGPFVQAEWNHGGLPYWLREIPDIIFRTNNEPFKKYMKEFVTLIVNKLKEAKLFASQGGPIILSQIENEYQHLEVAFKEEGTKYINWAAKMAISTDTGVPWIMCKQTKAPGEVIPTCNGRHCGDTWPGPTDKNKPLLWTENWTAQYRVFGDPPSQRSAEDIAFSVARFFSVGGTMANYYMYHGGTNFGRNGASFVMPRYYDEAPLDEFGLYKEPKWGHLRDLHHALRLCKKALLWGNPSVQPLGNLYEARIFEIPEQKVCVAFLSNHNTKEDGTVTFRGQKYFVARRSVSILADCKTVVFSTQHVNSQHNQRTFHFADQTVQNNVWEMFSDEKVPRYSQTKIRTQRPLEQYNMTKDKTDYLWYTTSFRLEADDLPFRKDIKPVLEVSSHGHAMIAFVNDVFVGCGHGTKINKAFTLDKVMDLKVGVNHISVLSSTLGMMDSGSYLEHRQAGVHTVTIQGLNTGTLDLTTNGWGHVVGLDGERRSVHTDAGMSAVKWNPGKNDRPMTWYRRHFDAPSGDDPVVIDLTPMGKGLVFVNGEGLGRYWVSYHHALGKPSQYLYHVPRSLLKPTANILMIFEEEGGKPEAIMILTVKRDNICTFISEKNPAHIRSWERKESQLTATAGDLRPKAVLSCPPKKTIQSIVFASYGNPLGICGNYTFGSCHAARTKEVVEKACVGKKTCSLTVSHDAYGGDVNCPGTTATLAVQAKCSKRPPPAAAAVAQ